MPHEEYRVGNSSINSEISLSSLTPFGPAPATPVQHICVVKGTSTSIENPIGNDARVYVGQSQFDSLKSDLTAKKRVVVRYDALPTPTQHPAYEEIRNFSHYTI